MPLSVGVVVVHYRHAQITARCLQSLLQHTSAHLYVVDNGSANDSLAQLQQQFQEQRITWLPLTDNRGYGAGANAGISAAWQDRMEAILLLNNDTWIADDVVAILSERSHAYHHQALLTGTIYQPDGQVWYSGGRLDLTAVRSYHRQHLASEGFLNFISGCMIWMPRQVHRSLGGFNEDFFMYWEDGDLSLRASKNGIPMVYIPHAKIWHHGSASSSSELAHYYQNRNRWAIVRQHGTRQQQLLFAIRSGLGMGWKCLKQWPHGHIHWQAWNNGWRGECGRRKQTG